VAPQIIVFDKSIAPDAFREIFLGWALISAGMRKPRIPYGGLYPDDEDHFDVLQLGWENDGLVITPDGAMLNKARDFGRCGSRGHYLNGVIVLPAMLPQQVRSLRDLTERRLQIVNIGPSEDPITVIRDCNLGLDLRLKQLSAIQLCDCPYDFEVERERRRYKRK
jgi:hypothetical protein